MNPRQTQGSGASAQGTVPATLLHPLARDKEVATSLQRIQRRCSHSYRLERTSESSVCFSGDGAAGLAIESLQATRPACTESTVL